MFTRKWQIVHRRSSTDFAVLADRYWFRASAARDARALNANRDESFGAVIHRLVNGSDVYVVASVSEVRAMELERARLRELVAHQRAEEANRLRDQRARPSGLKYGPNGEVEFELHMTAEPLRTYEPRSKAYVPEAQVPDLFPELNIAALPEPWRGRRGKPIERNTDASLADGSIGICREPRAQAPAGEHDLGHRLPGDVPAQGAAGADQLCDGPAPAGDAGSSDCGAGGSHSTD